jgi:hypothetical protein
VRRHIAHASRVLSIPVTIVKIPIMRFIFVSVERLRGVTCPGKVVVKCPDEAAAIGSARLWLICSTR